MWNTYGWWLLATVAFWTGIILMALGLAWVLLVVLRSRRPGSRRATAAA